MRPLFLSLSPVFPSPPPPPPGVWGSGHQCKRSVPMAENDPRVIDVRPTVKEAESAYIKDDRPFRDNHPIITRIYTGACASLRVPSVLGRRSS